MSQNGFSRRHFFYGTLLAGAVPAGGFGSVPSLTSLGYKSPNELVKEKYGFPVDIELEYRAPQGSDRVAEVKKCFAFIKQALA